jgi:predicted alpha/beta hydrolase family esterase
MRNHQQNLLASLSPIGGTGWKCHEDGDQQSSWRLQSYHCLSTIVYYIGNASKQLIMDDKLEGFQVLVVPGLNGSGPGHWQTLWEGDYPDWRRVEQRDWAHPEVEHWVSALDQAVGSAQRPVILVAHSLGCIAVAHWGNQRNVAPAAGALLVAPANVERESRPESVAGFAPIPRSRLRFPSLLVGSENDPHGDLPFVEALAASWGSRFANAGCLGHINLASGHGPWIEGEKLLNEVLSLACSSLAPSVIL